MAMKHSERLIVTRYIWSAFAAGMFFLFTSLIAGGASLSAGYVVIAIVMSLAAFLSTSVIWTAASSVSRKREGAAKAKRQAQGNLDAILERLSDDELVALRDRLSDETDTTGLYLSDDGELMRR